MLCCVRWLKIFVTSVYVNNETLSNFKACIKRFLRRQKKTTIKWASEQKKQTQFTSGNFTYRVFSTISVFVQIYQCKIRVYVICLCCIILYKRFSCRWGFARQRYITLKVKLMNYLQLDKCNDVKYLPLQCTVTLEPMLVFKVIGNDTFNRSYYTSY